jgi:hypothetical protein
MTWWESLHISLTNIVAGFSGGVVNAFVLKRSDPWSIIGSVIVGALVANYLAEMSAKWTGTSEHVAAFLVGVGGMGLVQGLIEAMKRWRPFGSTEGEQR